VVAGATEQPRLVTWVLVLPYRNPVLTDFNPTGGLSLWRGSWMLASVSP
jgi:hypothetical protein